MPSFRTGTPVARILTDETGKRVRGVETKAREVVELDAKALEPVAAGSGALGPMQ